MKILIIAGESSGDLHGANLVRALKECYSERIVIPAQAGIHAPNIDIDSCFRRNDRKDEPLQIYGVGGPKMAAAGVELLADITAYAGMGLEPVRNLAKFTALFRQMVHFLGRERSDVVVPIDFPDFNLRFAAKAHQYKIPVYYYVSPQVWAWRKGRIKDIKKYVTKLLCLFEFEKEFYKPYNVPVEFVGHPLLDEIADKQLPDKGEARRRLGLPEDELVIGLLPGSRASEFSRHFPLMLKSIPLIKTSRPIRYALAAAPNIKPQIIPPAPLSQRGVRGDFTIRTYYNQTYDVIIASDLLIAASGTVCLEAAILGVPMVVIYKVALLTDLIAGPLIKVPYYSIVNLVAGKEVVPELMQSKATPGAIADKVTELLGTDNLARMKQELVQVKAKLGPPGASMRAAKIVLQS
ncbi:MAG: lipid-A-disaccharide synthase [Planctomycetes bacterium]|nr:lipid-A-disaccharide synthase [Planctomycetota bacterium]